MRLSVCVRKYILKYIRTPSASPKYTESKRTAVENNVTRRNSRRSERDEGGGVNPSQKKARYAWRNLWTAPKRNNERRACEIRARYLEITEEVELFFRPPVLSHTSSAARMKTKRFCLMWRPRENSNLQSVTQELGCHGREVKYTHFVRTRTSCPISALNERNHLKITTIFSLQKNLLTDNFIYKTYDQTHSRALLFFFPAR